jgi:hypothetical protein
MKRWTHWFIIGTFVMLYAIVSIISTIHVIDFFKLSNPTWLAVSLAIAFEIGAAASLASIIVMDKMNKALIWFLFILLTGMQMMGNTFFAYTHLENFNGWVELFGLVDEEPIYQKRILSIISGAILPLVALGFIKSLVDYIRPSKTEESVNDQIADEPKDDMKDVQKRVWNKVIKLREEGKLYTPTKEDLLDEPTALAFTPYDLEQSEEDYFTFNQELLNEEVLETEETEETEETIEDIQFEVFETEEDNQLEVLETEEIIEDIQSEVLETEEALHTEEEKRQVIEDVTSNSPNNPSSVEINNINRELTEDDIKKYGEATKSSPVKRDYHPQVFKR